MFFVCLKERRLRRAGGLVGMTGEGFKRFVLARFILYPTSNA
jgi:hypothetical protein